MNPAMNAPVVLPVLGVSVDHAGKVRVELDGQPYETERTLRRSDLREVINQITAALRSAVRIEVTEADGSTYTDIELPPELPTIPPAAAPDDEPALPVAAPGIWGSGFRPGETVALAYVVLKQAADVNGHTSVHLPPAVLRRGPLLLVGLDSRVTALIEAPA